MVPTLLVKAASRQAIEQHIRNRTNMIRNYSQSRLKLRTFITIDLMMKNLIEYLLTKCQGNLASSWVETRGQGTTKIKEAKIILLVHKHELFKMKDSETISETCSLDIVSDPKALGENIPMSNWSTKFFDLFEKLGTKSHCYIRPHKLELD